MTRGTPTMHTRSTPRNVRGSAHHRPASSQVCRRRRTAGRWRHSRRHGRSPQHLERMGSAEAVGHTAHGVTPLAAAFAARMGAAHARSLCLWARHCSPLLSGHGGAGPLSGRAVRPATAHGSPPLRGPGSPSLTDSAHSRPPPPARPRPAPLARLGSDPSPFSILSSTDCPQHVTVYLRPRAQHTPPALAGPAARPYIRARSGDVVHGSLLRLFGQVRLYAVD